MGSTELAQLERKYLEAGELHQRSDRIEFFGFTGFFAIQSYAIAQNDFYSVTYSFMALLSALAALVVLYRIATLNSYLRNVNDTISELEKRLDSFETVELQRATKSFFFRYNRIITWGLMSFGGSVAAAASYFGIFAA